MNQSLHFSRLRKNEVPQDIRSTCAEQLHNIHCVHAKFPHAKIQMAEFLALFDRRKHFFFVLYYLEDSMIGENNFTAEEQKKKCKHEQ